MTNQQLLPFHQTNNHKTNLQLEDIWPVIGASWHGAAQAVLAAIHHKIAIDIHIVQNSSDGGWDLNTEPPLDKFSPEVAAAMNATALYDADMATEDIDTLKGTERAKACVRLKESTLRRFAKRLAKTGEEEIKTSDGYFVPLPDWSERCTGQYLQDLSGAASSRGSRDVRHERKATDTGKRENLEQLYERALRIISDNAEFFAWVKARLFDRQAVSAREIREYLGWQ